MANTPKSGAGDSGATSSTETVGTNSTPDAKGAGKAEEFKSVELTRERDGQKRTAHTLADKVQAEFDGFRAPTKK